MIDLALAIACGLTIAMIFKHAARTGTDRISLLTVNYAAASLLSGAVLFLSHDSPATDPVAPFILLALATGSLFILGFFLLALATLVAGMSLATAVMRVSVVIPFLASWLIWNEAPSTFQGAGLAIAGIAFFMISYRSVPVHHTTPDVHPTTNPAAKPDRWPLSVFLVLSLLFLVGGIVDTLMKTFDESFAGNYSRSEFMAMAFGIAFVVGAVLIGVRRRPALDRRSVVWGLILGAVNFGSVEFILRAIHALSGPFVFPANNIGLVIGGAVLGVTVWNERLSGANWIGLALAAAALVLLSL